MRTNFFVRSPQAFWQSSWCFEHSDDISCSLLVNSSHTDESRAGRNTCMLIDVLYKYIYVLCIYIYIIYIYIYILLVVVTYI